MIASSQNKRSQTSGRPSFLNPANEPLGSIPGTILISCGYHMSIEFIVKILGGRKLVAFFSCFSISICITSFRVTIVLVVYVSTQKLVQNKFFLSDTQRSYTRKWTVSVWVLCKMALLVDLRSLALVWSTFSWGWTIEGPCIRSSCTNMSVWRSHKQDTLAVSCQLENGSGVWVVERPLPSGLWSSWRSWETILCAIASDTDRWGITGRSNVCLSADWTEPPFAACSVV